MSNNGKQGERLFKQIMQGRNYTVVDVSNNEEYFDKDIDFIITSPTSGQTKTFEVKWDSCISSTGNLFLEIKNPRSKQWNGDGWYKHCQADFLVYGDAVKRQFYVIPFGKLKEREKETCCRQRTTNDGSTGYLLPLKAIEDLYIIL